MLDVTILKAKNKALNTTNLTVLGDIISKNKIPNKSGIYAFWWVGDTTTFRDKIINCHFELKGSKSQPTPVGIKFDNDWLEAAYHNEKTCLYIGKTTNLKKRIGMHIKPKTNDIWKGENISFGIKPNTVSQLRIGLERIFNENNMLLKMKANVAVSWVELDGLENCINRFYLEGMAIGSYFPLLNIDIER